MLVYALKMVGLRLDLFGQAVMAHLVRLRSRCVHSEFLGVC